MDNVQKHNNYIPINSFRNLRQSYKYRDSAWRIGNVLSEFRTIQAEEEQ
jgi:hypothetical protein